MKSRCFSILAVCIGCLSCQDSQTDKLLSLAEDQVWENPDSTLLILEQITSPEKLKGSRQADFALLLTQAQYRSEIIAPSDSLINVAIDYYKDKNNADKTGACYLYKGGVLSDLNNPVEAMQAYKQAEEQIPKMKDKRLIARIYCGLGYLNHECYNYDLAKEYHIKSLSVNSLAGYTSSVATDLINLGSLYHFHNQYDSISWCSNQLLKIVSEVDSNLQAKIYHNIAVEKMQQEKYSEAEKYLMKLNEITLGKISSKALSAWGKLYFKTGRKEKADSLLQVALQTSDFTVKASIYSTLYKKAEEKEDYQKEVEYLKEYINATDSAEYSQESAEIRKLQLKYDQSVSLRKNAELRKNLYLAILVAIGLMAILSFLYYRTIKMYRKRKEKELSARKQEVIRLQTRIEELQIMVEENENILKKEKDKAINEIIALQDEKRNKEIRIKQLETMFRAKNITVSTVDAEAMQAFFKLKQVKEYAPATDRDRLCHWIDMACQNFATRLDEQYPSLTGREKDICYLCVLGFTLEDIASLLKIQPRSTERYISNICEKFGFEKGSKEAFVAFIRNFCYQQINRTSKQVLCKGAI
ncbi:hypothetical protein [uncultured Bacteroides sp.]|uniref:hypothetical protein n=1 Tax=uncultured Bacteroides sp. TaxID=162156 RepID=UPI0025E3B448|nr:hypothetical protein [uncultured Bacteroides sp.]